MKWLFLTIICLSQPLWAGDVERLQSALETLKTFEASFEQTIFSARFGDENANGKMLVERPSKMVWLYDVPQKRIFLADGETFYRYDATDGVEHETPQAEFMEQPTSFFFLWKQVDLNKHYTIATQTLTKGKTQFTLTPTAKDADMKEIKMDITFDPFVIHRIETTDTLDQRNELRFAKTKVNTKLSKDAFDYVKQKKKIK